MRCTNFVSLSFAILVCAFNTGCGDLELDLPAGSEAKQENASPDDDALAMIRNKEVAEAKAWLADEKGHVLWKGDRGEIKQLVERLYGAGAPKVYAAGISKDGPNEIVAQFMAELPSDAAARARIFQVQSAFWKSYLDEPTEDDLQMVIEEDKGQKYLIFNFDL